MALVRAAGCEVTLVVMSPVGEYLRPELARRWPLQKRSVSSHFGLTIVRLPATPKRIRDLRTDAAIFRLWLTRSCRHSPRVIIHCRGTRATQTALRGCANVPRFTVLTDCRGMDAPEMLMVQGLTNLSDAPAHICERYAELESQQRSTLASSDAILCVSNAMKRELSAMWGLPQSRVHVVPCGTDVEVGKEAFRKREHCRRALGLDGKFVVAYNGSLSPWQMLPQTISVFRHIASIRSDAHFVAVTTNVGAMRNILQHEGVSTLDSTVLSVPHAEVPWRLAAADLGLLIRDDSLVNRVASPVKFAEYLSCGVPVVLTRSVGDYAALVRDLGIGCVLRSCDLDDDAKAQLEAFLARYCRTAASLRQACLSTAAESLSADRMAALLLESYRGLEVDRKL
jgi:glycosyltransferase involved in cell wall biosynthesis